MAEMNVTVEFKIKDSKIKLTLKEAEELRDMLKKLFPEPQVVTVDKWHYPWYNPWIYHWGGISWDVNTIKSEDNINILCSYKAS